MALESRYWKRPKWQTGVLLQDAGPLRQRILGGHRCPRGQPAEEAVHNSCHRHAQQSARIGYAEGCGQAPGKGDLSTDVALTFEQQPEKAKHVHYAVIVSAHNQWYDSYIAFAHDQWYNLPIVFAHAAWDDLRIVFA